MLIKFPSRPFDKEEHTLEIVAPGAKDNMYVKDLSLDGKSRTKPSLTHEELYRTKRLQFSMSKDPQKWGVDNL